MLTTSPKNDPAGIQSHGGLGSDVGGSFQRILFPETWKKWSNWMNIFFNWLAKNHQQHLEVDCASGSFFLIIFGSFSDLFFWFFSDLIFFWVWCWICFCLDYFDWFSFCLFLFLKLFSRITFCLGIWFHKVCDECHFGVFFHVFQHHPKKGLKWRIVSICFKVMFMMFMQVTYIQANRVWTNEPTSNIMEHSGMSSESLLICWVQPPTLVHSGETIYSFCRSGQYQPELGGGFKDFSYSPLFGEDSQFD